MELFRRLRPFMALVALLVLANLVLEHINGRFWLNDFRVYYMAADNMRHGLPVYGEVFGEDTGLYKYAPVVLYFFEPSTYLPFPVAGVLHCLLIGGLVVGCFVVIERTLGHFTAPLPKPVLRAVLGLLCIVVLLARELHLGNINMALILLSAWGVERLMAGKTRAAGLLLGAVWLIKPYLLLMLVPLVMRREWRVVRTGAATMLAGLLIPLLLEGPAEGWALTTEWFGSMLYHNQVMSSNDHFGAFLGRLTGQPSSILVDVLFIALAGLLLAWFTWRNQGRRGGGNFTDMDRSFELWLAMALVPNLVITDQQHFMFSLPLVLYLLAYLFTHRDRNVLWAFLLALLPYATRSSDLWGSTEENRLVGWGVLGMGNILLMAVALWGWERWRTQAPSAGPERVTGR